MISPGSAISADRVFCASASSRSMMTLRTSARSCVTVVQRSSWLRSMTVELDIRKRLRLDYGSNTPGIRMARASVLPEKWCARFHFPVPAPKSEQPKDPNELVTPPVKFRRADIDAIAELAAWKRISPTSAWRAGMMDWRRRIERERLAHEKGIEGA
jgi:hypothetical protein